MNIVNTTLLKPKNFLIIGAITLIVYMGYKHFTNAKGE